MKLMLTSEKTCCRSKNGYAWSFKLVKSGKLVQYWKMRQSSLRNQIDFNQLQYLTRLLKVEDNAKLTLSAIDRKLTAAL
eukprot:4511555-Ditylum_brightwellii.AAC.1